MGKSSWMMFGPAGRETYDWMAASASPTSVENHLQGYNWNDLLPDKDVNSGAILYIVLPLALLVILSITGFLFYRRFSRNKLNLANIVALDLQNTESCPGVLSSLTGHAERLDSCSSDTSDGVFLVVYLPPPFEETLTRITRAGSLSSGKDVETEDLEDKLCPELKFSGIYV